jgi:hypothetical protein
MNKELLEKAAMDYADGGYNHVDYMAAEGFKRGAEWHEEQNKLSTPTDKEIDLRARQYHFSKTKEVFLDSSRPEWMINFVNGYKQALKDLGHE